ncbi:MAG: hypothetical protein HPY53_15420 [Brevinematales bacterium]|nr:hypothetical protein [Brevinematales bacterium]
MTDVRKEHSKIQLNLPLNLSKHRGAPYYNPVSVSVLDEMPEIKKFIIENEILINNDFFYIGNLIREGITRSDIINDLSSIILEGSDSEKEKYKLLWNLNKVINNYNEALYGFNQLAHYNYLSFVLSNNGTLADEDIEVKIFLTKDSLMQIDAFPIKKYFRIDNKIISFKGIINETETHEIKEYDTPIMGLELTYNLYSVDDEQKKIQNDFKMYNDYNSFTHEDKQILVFNFKKLNNHCKMFFPCRLFFKEKFREIKYEIKSKNIPEIIKGTLKINDE